MRARGVYAVSVLVALAALCIPRAAAAFHVGSLFADPPGKGGGGGIYYTGAPADKGWDCTACHINPERRIKVLLSTMPQTLLSSLSYTPAQAYTMTLSLGGEHKGQASARSNYNGFVLSIFDKSGKPAGKISGFAPEEIYAATNTTIGSAGLKVNASTWTFTWTAPAAGTGEVTIYIAMVDGNGAESPPNVTLTDPFGDDVVTGKLVLRDATSAQLGTTFSDGKNVEIATSTATPLDCTTTKVSANPSLDRRALYAFPIAMMRPFSVAASFSPRLDAIAYSGPLRGPFSGGPYESALGLFLSNAVFENATKDRTLRLSAPGSRTGWRVSGRCHPA